MMTLLPFLQVVLSCVILKYACDLFEQNAGYLGRNMPAGIKGATVNAIGSSMPEMMSAVALLFFYNDPNLFGIALGITAGSGVFNSAVIPSLAILFAKDENGKPVDHIELDKRSLIRDVFWVVASDVALIAMIMNGYISVWMAVLLNLIYVGYALHLYLDARRSGSNEVEEYEEEELKDRGLIGNIVTSNFKPILFGNECKLDTNKAIVLLSIAIVIITLGSHMMVEGVIGSSDVLAIPNFISGLILGAAASSIPDLILSVKDAQKGEYEDAVANPLASNTFDTSISVGLPLLIWLLVHNRDGIELTSENMEALRISVVGMSAAVGATLLFKHKKVTKGTATFMLGLYGAWITWIVITYL